MTSMSNGLPVDKLGDAFIGAISDRPYFCTLQLQHTKASRVAIKWRICSEAERAST
jgi:hypothetical protein